MNRCMAQPLPVDRHLSLAAVSQALSFLLYGSSADNNSAGCFPAHTTHTTLQVTDDLLPLAIDIVHNGHDLLNMAHTCHQPLLHHLEWQNGTLDTVDDVACRFRFFVCCCSPVLVRGVYLARCLLACCTGEKYVVPVGSHNFLLYGSTCQSHFKNFRKSLPVNSAVFFPIDRAYSTIGNTFVAAVPMYGRVAISSPHLW
jgi:hypothetical protein